MKRYEPAEKLTQSELRVAAINLLSRREYSRHELETKLIDRSENTADLTSVLDLLTELCYQSDQRFSGSFLRSRIYRGLGPMRVQRELQEKGIDQDLIAQALEEESPDWFELAVESGRNKAQRLDLSDFKQKQKFYRYLSYRGFAMAEIQYAVEQLNQSFD